LFTFVLIVHVIVSLLLMMVILLQDGKGGDIVSTMGGGGGSQTVFGSTGATNFLTKGTIALTVIFVITSLTLAVLKTREKRSILDTVKPAVEVTAPVDKVVPVEKKDGEVEKNVEPKTESTPAVEPNKKKDATGTTEEAKTPEKK